MNVKKVDQLSPTKVRLSITVEAKEVEAHEKTVLQKFAQKVSLPGFRPGKVPVSLVKEKYREEIRGDVISGLLEDTLTDAVEQAKKYPILRPRIQIKGDPLKFEQGFEFEAEFDVRPEIKLKKYKNLKIEEPEANIADEEISQVLEHLRDHLSVLHPSELKKPEKGMFAVVEMGLQVPGEEKQPAKVFTVELGVEKLLPELDAGLLTMNVGDKKEITATFAKDYGDPKLAGKSVLFDCHMLELKRKKLPELNDNFADQVKKGSTLLSLRGEIRKDIESKKKQEAKQHQKNQLLDSLLRENDFEVPESMVLDQSKALENNVLDGLGQAGESKELSPEDKKTIQKKAEIQVKSSFLLHEIAQQEKLSVDNAELDGRLKTMAVQLNKSPQDTEKWLKGKGLWAGFKEELLLEKVFDFLLAQAERVPVQNKKKPNP